MKLNELSKRIIVSLVGIPLAIFIIFSGGWLFAISIIIISSIGLWEFFGFAEKKGVKTYTRFGIISNILLMALIFYLLQLSQTETFAFWLFISIAVMIVILLILLIALFSSKPNSLLNAITTLGGIIYVSFTFMFLIILREFGNVGQIISRTPSDIQIFLTGKEANFFLSILISIWICDSAAYFTGKSIGKHKLFPSVSPKKTWEGAIGGFIFAVISFIIAANLSILIDGFPLQHSIVIGIIIGIFGQTGDLAQSKLKRDAGVKDSSAIIPGHGGILDRFDSIMFVVPIVVIYLIIISTVF